MWYIFPQIEGLAFSSMLKQYAIKSIEEARAYLTHPVLGSRLLECAEAVVDVEGLSVAEIFGSPDDLKSQSCITLFACVSPAGFVFGASLRSIMAVCEMTKLFNYWKNSKNRMHIESLTSWLFNGENRNRLCCCDSDICGCCLLRWVFVYWMSA